jgi:hypothetical protein
MSAPDQGDGAGGGGGRNRTDWQPLRGGMQHSAETESPEGFRAAGGKWEGGWARLALPTDERGGSFRAAAPPGLCTALPQQQPSSWLHQPARLPSGPHTPACLCAVCQTAGSSRLCQP